MSISERSEEQIAVALDYVQGKRRIEHVIEAASALAQRHADEPDPQRRLNLTFELIRRNFGPQVAVSLGEFSTRTSDFSTGSGTLERRFEFTGPDGRRGHLHARYTPPGTLGLTGSEWASAMVLLAQVTGLGIGGRVTCLP